jgi:hypothetical protein
VFGAAERVRSVRAGCCAAALLLLGCGEKFSSDDKPGRARHLVLNEVDYNNVDFDYSEFVEILNASDEARELKGIALVLVNGANAENREYARFELSGTLDAGKYLVFTSGTVDVPPDTMTQGFQGQTDQIQNGGNEGDAIGLFDTTQNQLIDALSYEGPVHDAQIAGAGNFDFVEGNPTTIRDPGEGAMARSPDGHDSDDAASDWKLAPPTPGAPNP